MGPTVPVDNSSDSQNQAAEDRAAAARPGVGGGLQAAGLRLESIQVLEIKLGKRGLEAGWELATQLSRTHAHFTSHELSNNSPVCNCS